MYRTFQIFVISNIMIGVSLRVHAVEAAFIPGTYQLALPGASGNEPVSLDDLRTWRDWLLEHGFAVDRCGHDISNGTVTVEIRSEDQLLLAQKAGFTLIQFLLQQVEGAQTIVQEAYFDPDEIMAMLSQLSLARSDIISPIMIGQTFKGRTIWGIEISDNPGIVEDEPAILFNGQHHARELVTSHIVMDIIETLTEGYGVDPDITQWVNSYKTICIPMVNPDGVRYVFDVNHLWRRNRQVYVDCTGVDLNRNYPYLWGPGCGSSGTCNDIFRGPYATSEMETQGMIGLANLYHFAMATSYHSFGRFIDYPYACSDGTPGTLMPEHDVIDEMMHGVADAIFGVDGIAYEVFSPLPLGGVNGDDTSWYYAQQGTYSFILEVGESFEPPFGEVAGIVARNRGGWRYMYERLGQARIDIHVKDACTHEPLEAEVTLVDFVYDTGEWPRKTYLPFGRWTYLVVPNQSYTVRVSLPDHITQEVTVFVADSPAELDIFLEPEIFCAQGGVPTVSAWGFVVMVLVFMVVGSLVLRRKQFIR